MVGYSQTGRSERLVATQVWPAMMMRTAPKAAHRDSGSGGALPRRHEVAA